MEQNSVLIESGQLAAFQKRLDSLNKKAAAFGLAPIRVLGSEELVFERNIEYCGRDMDRMLVQLVPVSRGRKPDHPVLITRIDLEFPTIKLGTWKVIAKLEAAGDKTLAFAVSHTPEDSAAIATRVHQPIGCEHCAKKRRRNDAYLLRDAATQAYKLVGKNCLEDFTGINPAAALFLARMSAFVRLVEGELEQFCVSGRSNAVSTRQYLAMVSHLSEETGFLSVGKARETGNLPTYAAALNCLAGGVAKSATEFGAHTERHLACADAVIDWVATKPEESLFDHNLKLLLGSDALSIDRKHLAFAAAAVPMYHRAHRAEKEPQKPSEHIGTPGQKLTATLTVDRIVPIETAYGYVDLVLLADAAGNRIKWKTSSCPHELRKGGAGKTIDATFKIKGHEEYKGIPQTSVTHLKITRWVDFAEAA